MRYIQRDENGKICGHFANEQSYAKELVPDDHPDIVQWDIDRRPKPRPPRESYDVRIEKLMARVDALEATVTKLSMG